MEAKAITTTRQPPCTLTPLDRAPLSNRDRPCAGGAVRELPSPFSSSGSATEDGRELYFLARYDRAGIGPTPSYDRCPPWAATTIGDGRAHLVT